MRTNKLAGVILFLGCLTPVWAQDAPPPPQDGQTPSEYSMETIAYYLAAADRELAKTETPEKISAKPTATAATSGFGERVNDSISDFLPLFQFAVNAVSTSDDSKSVTIKANPIKGSWGALSIEATLVEPEISSALLDDIVEAARETQKEMLLDQTDDLDNIIWSVSYGYVKNGAKAEWGRTRRLWGRDYKTYEKLAGRLFQALWKGDAEGGAQRSTRAEDLLRLGRLEDEIGDVFPLGPDVPERLKFSEDQTTFEQIRKNAGEGMLRGSFLTEYVAALNADARAVADIDIEAGKANLDELAGLIDNQPQLVANYSFRDRDRFVGANEHSFELKIEWGRRNFNKVLKQYRELNRSAVDPQTVRSDRVLEAYSRVLEKGKFFAEDKFSFSVNYKKTEDNMFTYDYNQTVTDPMTMMDTVIPRMAMVNQEESKDWTGSLQWTHTMVSQELKIGGQVVHPRLALALDYTDVENEMVKNSRFTARVTYTYPLTETVSLPISLVYSDDPEFVRMSMPDKVFSAHAGLSYKIKRNGK